MSRPVLCHSCEDVMTQHGYVYVPGHFFQPHVVGYNPTPPPPRSAYDHPYNNNRVVPREKLPSHAPPTSAYYGPRVPPPPIMELYDHEEDDEETNNNNYDDDYEETYDDEDEEATPPAVVPLVEAKSEPKVVAAPPQVKQEPVVVKLVPFVAEKSADPQPQEVKKVVPEVKSADTKPAPKVKSVADLMTEKRSELEAKSKPKTSSSFANIIKKVAKEDDYVCHGGGQGVEDWDESDARIQSQKKQEPVDHITAAIKFEQQYEGDGMCKMCHLVAPYHPNQQYCKGCFNTLPFCTQGCGYRTNQKNGLCSHCFGEMKVLCSECNVRYTIYDSGVCHVCYWENKNQKQASYSDAAPKTTSYKEQQCANEWSQRGKITKCQNRTTYKYCKSCHSDLQSTL